jgi:hypothetical protein
MWAPYSAHTGMAVETSTVYRSEESPFLRGFNLEEPSRERGGIFYQIAYLLGATFTVPGDFLLYQIVYAGLWWARGFLAFLVVRRLLRGHAHFAYLVGALVLVHASDAALQQVSLLNIVGMFFWMTLAFYLFAAALQSAGGWRQGALLAGSCTATYLALWSYESSLPIVAVFAGVALAAHGRFDRRRLLLAGAYGAVVAVDVVRLAIRYTNETGTYQQSVMRQDWSVGAIASDLIYQLEGTLEFWNWPLRLGNLVQISPQVLWGLPVAAAALVILGGLAIQYGVSERDRGSEQRVLLLAALVGVALCVLSFPAYLLLGRTLYRTQMLSSFGVAVVFASLACTAAIVARRRTAQTLIACGVVAPVVLAGVQSALIAGEFHHERWELHRRAVEQVLTVAGSIRPNTVVVVVNVPDLHDQFDFVTGGPVDPFGDDFWFDVALRLAYPEIPVTGIYYYQQQQRMGPGSPLVVEDGRWKWKGGGSFRPLVQDAPFSNTVIVRYETAGEGRLLRDVPDYISADAAVAATYDPGQVITADPLSPRARRLYVRGMAVR